MTFVFLVIGTILFFTGKFSIGTFKAEGQHVKDAGIVLMLPAAGSFLLGIILGLVFAGNFDALFRLINVLLIVELVAVIGAARIAYRLLVNPALSLSSMMSNWQTPPAAIPENPTPAIKPTKSIMTLEEAAQYLDKTPAEVLALIESGQIAAARVNYRYQIARSVLDEILKHR